MVWHRPAGINRDTPEVDADWLAAYVVSKPICIFSAVMVPSPMSTWHMIWAQTHLYISRFINHMLGMLTVSSPIPRYTVGSVSLQYNTKKKSSQKKYAGNSWKYLTVLITDCSNAVLKVLLTQLLQSSHRGDLDDNLSVISHPHNFGNWYSAERCYDWVIMCFHPLVGGRGDEPFPVWWWLEEWLITPLSFF